MADEQQVREALKAISDAHWDVHGAPVLLSDLPEKLEAKAEGYKEALGRKSLKAFIRDANPDSGFKLIEHPTQRAKLGVAPVHVEYEFPAEEPRPGARQAARAPRGSTQEPVLAFLRALGTLPAEEVEKVVIPVAVLIKLLK